MNRCLWIFLLCKFGDHSFCNRNRIPIYKHLVRKQRLDHLAKLPFFQARNFLTFRQLQSARKHMWHDKNTKSPKVLLTWSCSFLKVKWSYNDGVISTIHITLILIGVFYLFFKIFYLYLHDLKVVASPVTAWLVFKWVNFSKCTRTMAVIMLWKWKSQKKLNSPPQFHIAKSPIHSFFVSLEFFYVSTSGMFIIFLISA